MKKWISIFVAAALMVASLTACGQETAPQEETTLQIGALQGPTAMGMAVLMDNANQQKTSPNLYEFTVEAAPDALVPLLAKGELDIAAVPANLSSTLYQNTDKQISVLAINTLGVLYIVENGNTVNSVEDLQGKTIYASGKGSTPEFALNYIFQAHDIDVNIEWKTEHAECVAALQSDEDGIAMLPQPFVTVAQSQNPELRIALDLNDAWDELGTESGLLTGVLVVRNEVLEQQPEAVSLFLEQYADSVASVNENPAQAAPLIEKYVGGFTAEVAEKAIPYCNIVCITGEEMQQKLSGYLEVLYEQNPASVGNALPEYGFYYHAS